MTDSSSKINEAEASPEDAPKLSKRDQALAVVDEFMTADYTPRPKSGAGEPAPADFAAPINIEEVRAEGEPLKSRPALGGAKKKPEKKGGRSGLNWFFQTLILLFVLVWVFIVGIFIGRGYLLESSLGRQFITRLEKFIGRADERPVMAVEEVGAGSPETPVAPTQPLDALGPAAALWRTIFIDLRSQNAPSNEDAADIFLTPETLAQQTPPEEAAPEPEPAPIPPAPPQLTPISARGYAVQTTYALSEQAANAVAQRLKRLDFPAYFYRNSRGQYLVRVGRFKNIEDAKAARDKLAAIGYKEPYISRLEPGER